MLSHDKTDLIVVGAGAAGLMAALTAADRGRRVLLLEKMDQPGRKLRITGKGRCNLTNTASLRDTLPHIGSDCRFLRNAYGVFFNRELMDFFERRGVALTVERGGRVFPASGKALDIFLALINPIERHRNITIRKGCRVERLDVADGVVQGVVLPDGTRLAAPHVVLATGGLSYPLTGSTGDGYRMAAAVGHDVVPCVPSLVALCCREPMPREMVGFTLRNVALRVTDEQGRKLCEQFGELTFASDGLTGPIVLSASRQVSRRLHEGETLLAHIDLKPAVDADTLDRRLRADMDANGSRLWGDAMRMWLPAELVPSVLRRMKAEKFKRLNQVTAAERRKLLALLKDFDFHLTGTHGFEEAIVTQGGVALKEVNPKTMESRRVAGLYLVGELLDLDADTGGYNLQMAFSTGFAAGSYA